MVSRRLSAAVIASAKAPTNAPLIPFAICSQPSYPNVSRRDLFSFSFARSRFANDSPTAPVWVLVSSRFVLRVAIAFARLSPAVLASLPKTARIAAPVISAFSPLFSIASDTVCNASNMVIEPSLILAFNSSAFTPTPFNAAATSSPPLRILSTPIMMACIF